MHSLGDKIIPIFHLKHYSMMVFKKKSLQQVLSGSEILFLSLYYAEQEIVQEETSRGDYSNKRNNEC